MNEPVAWMQTFTQVKDGVELVKHAVNIEQVGINDIPLYTQDQLEEARKLGMQQERALWNLSASTQEIMDTHPIKELTNRISELENQLGFIASINRAGLGVVTATPMSSEKIKKIWNAIEEQKDDNFHYGWKKCEQYYGFAHPVKELHLSLQKDKETGELLAVTYTDDEHRIVEVLWQKSPVKEHFEDEPQAEELHEILQSNTHPVKELTDEVKDALMDALSGWKYIRQCHGDLYGVGWDRVQDKLEAILRKASEK